MKTILTTLAVILTLLTVNAQSRLGSSVSEVKEEFWESKYKLIGKFNDENIYYISIETERASVFYWFDDEYICRMCAILPRSQGDLNFYVENYNSKYVVVSTTQWKMYSEFGIADVTLVYPEEGGYYFIWQ